MNISRFLKRAQNILSNPKKEFIQITTEQKKPIIVFLEYVLPFLLLYAAGRIACGIIFYEEGIDIVLKKVVFDIIVTIIGVYLASLVINEILPFFQAKKSRIKSFALVAYSLTPFYIASILSGMMPKLAMFFNLIIFFSIYIFWNACSAIVDMTIERRQIFVPLILLVILLIFLFNRILLGSIFSL